MYEPKPVAYCILDADMEKCEHIAYGVEDAPADAMMLYDEFSLQRVQRALEASEKTNEYLRSQLTAAKQPETSTQATEALPKYISNVVVKFVDGHIEHHDYSDETELDNATIIAQVKKMLPKGSVKNVMIVEKR